MLQMLTIWFEDIVVSRQRHCYSDAVSAENVFMSEVAKY